LPQLQFIEGARQPWDEPPPDEERRAQPDTVYVWNFSMQEGFDVAETDSTLRWIQLVNLFDRFFSIEEPSLIGWVLKGEWMPWSFTPMRAGT
jgi:hypothetical protein